MIINFTNFFAHKRWRGETIKQKQRKNCWGQRRKKKTFRWRLPRKRRAKRCNKNYLQKCYEVQKHLARKNDPDFPRNSAFGSRSKRLGAAINLRGILFSTPGCPSFKEIPSPEVSSLNIHWNAYALDSLAQRREPSRDQSGRDWAELPVRCELEDTARWKASPLHNYVQR